MTNELEIRIQKYSKEVRDLCVLLKRDLINTEYIRQVVRSSSSISANYTEASDDLGKADERMKIKLARREAKETIKWLDLILTYNNSDLERKRLYLLNEGEQIKRILSAILKKLETK